MNSSELELYLEAGFIDFTKETDERFLPKILTNNQNQQIKVLDNLLQELETCNDFFFSVAFVTNSGIACLVDTLKSLANKDIKGKILASQYQNFTEPRALRRLLQFKNIELKIITSDYNFHAKGYLFHQNSSLANEENYTMIIGSSNLTQSALTVNREWNVKLSSMKDGALIKQMQEELDKAWKDATEVTEEWIKTYEKIYHEAKKKRTELHGNITQLYKVNPNKMQVAALSSIEELRKQGEKKALLISATGTGKTYLAAFDVKLMQPKRCLFLVHRELIAKKSMYSFRQVIDRKYSLGLYSGNNKELDADYIFATIQTLRQDAHLHKFAPDTFDYIIVDEAHHAGADSYKKILDYFQPKFLLGMTATPERTDGLDIFEYFNHNIAYEIRLNQALSENMLVPFHYHGVSEINVNGQVLDEKSDFKLLTCDERVKHILHYANFYGCDQGRTKGLVFCSSKEEAKALCVAFNKQGVRSDFICGETSEKDRQTAIERLEKEDENDSDALSYIFSVDVLNEGVDIPSVNQIIMLRPTASAIIFVQQLGRGLRKSQSKRYLEVIDFIGNYENNYLLPIALYGDRTYNKEHVRRIMHNNFLPGASTVYFDDVAKEHIFKKLDTTNLKTLQSLRESYKLVKAKLGRCPLMMDFIALGDKDPYLFVEYQKDSYFAFRQRIDYNATTMRAEHLQMLKFLSLEIINGRRLEEIVLLEYLLQHDDASYVDFQGFLSRQYNLPSTEATFRAMENILNKEFYIAQAQATYGSIKILAKQNDRYSLAEQLKKLLNNAEFKELLVDALAYGRTRFLSDYEPKTYYHGMKLYSSYTRKDVCRILNWEKDTSSTVYGYRVHNNACPMFVTYTKSADISESTQYEDSFVNTKVFQWWTRNRVNIESDEVNAIRKPETLKLLFIKKSDDNGSEFYFMGPVSYNKAVGSTIESKGKKLSIVQIFYNMLIPVENKIYRYFVGN